MMAVAVQKNHELFSNEKSYCTEARRSSCADNVRFETLVARRISQSALEAHQRCNVSSDSYVIPVDQEQSAYQSAEGKACESEVQHGVDDVRNEGTENENKPTFPADNDDPSNEGITEEEAFLAKAIENDAADDTREQWAALILRMRDGISVLAKVLKTIESLNGMVGHVESRPSKTAGVQFDILLRVQMQRSNLLHLLRSLRQSCDLDGVSLLDDSTTVPATTTPSGKASVTAKDPWFPRHASDLDKCTHLMTKYEPELDMNHPGFADKVYRERRRQIADIAFNYKYGQPIPRIEYTWDENETWGGVFRTVLDVMPKYACSQYGRVFRLLQKEGIFREDRIPQLEEMSAFLKKHTGFTLRPCAGLLTSRDFLASLAFRVFQSTQYVRHKSTPYHTPEPDCIHEILGHLPLLADPGFAQFSQEIGLASLGASEEEIAKLSTVYWFTVEFGLCKENGDVKAYGAALLSSYGELFHAISDKPEHRPFEPAKTAVQPYQDQSYQPVYYVAESFEDAKEKFRRWVSCGMSRSFEVRFNPHTERVEVLDSVDSLEALVSQMNLEMMHLTNALNKLKSGC